MNSTMAISMALKPFIALVIMIGIVAPLKWLFIKLFPEGKIKRFLLRRTN